MSNLEYCQSALTTLKLKGISASLNEVLDEAQNDKISYLECLRKLLHIEIEDRNERRLKRNLTGAHLPVIKELEAFDFSNIKGITEEDVNNLLDFRWIDNNVNLLFLGPPGVGKTHLSVSLALKALEKGYKVCFERASNLIKLLKTAEIQRSSTFRINRIMKSSLLIIDEIGYTPIDRKEANLFFNLISELYERTSIIVTSNKGFDQWSEMMGDEVMTTAMLDRLLHHAQVYSISGESYRISQRKEE